jgi:hypothetical protein
MHGEKLDSFRDGGGDEPVEGREREVFIEGNQILSQLHFQP